MDVEKKYVLFEDKVDLEIFLTCCEENDITWPGKNLNPRYYLESDLENTFFVMGYCVYNGNLYDVRSLLYNEPAIYLKADTNSFEIFEKFELFN
jgi:hypothetical protein